MLTFDEQKPKGGSVSGGQERASGVGVVVISGMVGISMKKGVKTDIMQHEIIWMVDSCSHKKCYIFIADFKRVEANTKLPKNIPSAGVSYGHINTMEQLEKKDNPS